MLSLRETAAEILLLSATGTGKTVNLFSPLTAKILFSKIIVGF